MILNRAKDYYKNHKERLREQARYIYIETYLKKIRIKTKGYGKNRYHNMSDGKKQKLKECQKKYWEAKKSQSNNK